MEILKLVWSFLKIGAVSFGGGWTIVGLIRHEVVGGGMMTAEAFERAVAIAQITPGPVALNVATMAGWSVAGWAGAAAATLSVVAVPVACVLLLGVFAEKAKVPGRARLSEALRLGTLAMTAFTVMSLSSGKNFGWPLVGYSLVALVVTDRTKFPPALLILLCGAASAGIGLLERGVFSLP